MLLVEEVGRITGVHGHGCKSIPRTENSAGPFPDTAHLPLPGQAVAAMSHGDGVPVLESNIGTIEVGEQLRSFHSRASDLALGVGRGRFLDTIVREVTECDLVFMSSQG